ncbi:MAG: pyrrolo-quinoline quinone [Acidobacteriaceae bacterium]|nr:pyrrolo-quinoline quinone [Acidobacteriaceae bacterium]
MRARFQAATFRPLLALTAFLVAASCGGGGSSSSTVQIQPAPPPVQTNTNVLTYHNDIARTGQNLTETTLTHSNVNSGSFGKLFSIPVDGKVDAQPLYVSRLVMAAQNVHSVIYAATEHDSVYAIDANGSTVLWQVTLLAAGETPSDDRGCSQVIPEIGATATPVIDLNAGPHGTIYLLGMSKDNAGNYHHRLHALDLTTGQEEFAGPIEIAATYPGSGANSTDGEVAFDPKQYKSRPGLLLLNGVIYTGWGSHCDIGLYTGWLIGYDQLTLKQVSVFNFAPNGSGAALWNSGGGIAADVATSRIFVSVANGTFDTSLNAQGFPDANDFGNAFVKLNTLNRQLIPEDYWTMSNTMSESDQDLDLGSGGVMLLPDLTNAAGQTVQLGIGAGKDGEFYVFDRGNMGKFNPQNNNGVYQEIPGTPNRPIFSSPAWFNGTVYYGAVNDRIRAFSVSAAKLDTQPSSSTGTTFGYPGATPAISANGVNDAILWAVENADPAVLHAYDATNLAIELYNSDQAGSNRDSLGPGNKYITPTVADGRVIVGTTNSVAVFGLLK